MAKPGYLIKKYVHETETEDSLYYAPFYKEFGEDLYEKNIDPEYIKKGESDFSWNGEVTPMPIEELEKMIGEIKKKGATHIEVMYHEDHGNYVINGVEIRKPTQEEIDEHLGIESAKETKALEKKKKELEKELDGVNSKLKN